MYFHASVLHHIEIFHISQPPHFNLIANVNENFSLIAVSLGTKHPNLISEYEEILTWQENPQQQCENY